MTYRKTVGRHAIFKLEPGEGFEKCHKYVIFLDYDPDYDYTGLSGDLYTTSYSEALRKAAAWN